MAPLGIDRVSSRAFTEAGAHGMSTQRTSGIRLAFQRLSENLRSVYEKNYGKKKSGNLRMVESRCSPL
jgi:hypothetical protein